MWEQIRYNQTRSVMLIAVMGGLLVLLGYLLGLILGLSLFQIPSFFYIPMIISSHMPLPTHISIFDIAILGVIIASITWVVSSLVAYFRGDNILVGMSKAKKIRPNDNPRLRNIVGEMAIASGLEAMPAMYIIDDPALNAFAIGRDPKKAAVVVSSGLLTKLNRDELQGVIGHEIAHIRNRDVLLMVMCSVLFFTMIILTRLPANLSWGRITRTQNSSSLESAHSDSKSLVAIFVIIFLSIWIFLTVLFQFQVVSVVFVLALFLTPLIMAVLIGLPFVALIIYYALSRRREYLADASSALYTRYPEGLASALEKIAASTDQLVSANPATAPIYIVNPFRYKGKSASNFTRSHPPIYERIHILRAMAGASYADYDRAYRQIRGIDKSVIPAYTMATAGVAALRSALPEDMDYVHRARETSNLLWNINNYRIVNCACGTRLRLPPSFKLPEVRCPHCGKTNPVKTVEADFRSCPPVDFGQT